MEVTNQTEMSLICMLCKKEYSEGTQTCPDDGTQLTPLVPDPLVGQTFADKYEILAVLGRGGMSTVYKARHQIMNNLVAIKVLNKELVSDPSHMERFLQEARALAGLKHQNIVQVHDSGLYQQSQPYLVTELLQGESLEDILTRETHLAVDRSMHIFLQVCSGLQQAHKKGIIHRDLKTANILIVQEPDARDVVKLLDFGIAKVLVDGKAANPKLTKAGEVFGSPLYMSPEQCTGKEVDERSDIYSLGCVMYETLTGTPPHVGKTAMETMNMHVNEPVLPLRGIAPNLVIPDLVDAIVMKALKKIPEQRQQTMEELKKDLTEAAKRSRIYVESTAAKAGYTPNPFDVDMPKQAPIEEPTAEKSNEPSKEMQKLVLDAVTLADKQDRERKRLKGYLFVLYGLLAAGLIGFVSLMMWEGPPQDRAPMWKKFIWLTELNQGDDAVKSKNYEGAIEHFTKAEAIAREFQDQGDRRIKSLLALLKVYEVMGNKAEVEKIKALITEADMGRLDGELNTVSKDAKIQANLRTTLDVEQLDPTSAKKYSLKFTSLARQYLGKGQLENAHRALEKALAVEEFSKSENARDVDACANEILGACTSEEHKTRSKVLIERAHRLSSR